MHKSTLIAALAGVALILTGCGVSASETSDAGQGSNAPAASQASAGDKTAKPADDSGSDDSAGDDAAAKFGAAYTYKDGISVTVSAPKPYKPSEYAAGAEKYKSFVSFEVRLVNKTGSSWDPSVFSATVQSNNEEGEQVFDEGTEGAPDTKLLNGREVKFTIAYGVANPKDIVMEVNPDFDHDAVMFQS